MRAHTGVGVFFLLLLLLRFSFSCSFSFWKMVVHQKKLSVNLDGSNSTHTKGVLILFRTVPWERRFSGRSVGSDVVQFSFAQFPR